MGEEVEFSRNNEGDPVLWELIDESNGPQYKYEIMSFKGCIVVNFFLMVRFVGESLCKC